MSHVVVERELGGRTIRFETGKWAKLADASVFVTLGETSVLSAVVRGDPREGIDFFPLQIDYRERMSAAGKYPGGFRKREGAPSQREVLTMRLIDRPLRPLFPDGLFDEVLIQNWVESADGQNDPDVIAGTAAAAGVAISTIPHDGPLATVRIGRIDGQWVAMPTVAQMEYSDIDMIVSGHREGVNMIEVGSFEMPEAEVLEGIEFAHQQIQIILDAIDELVEKAGQEKHANLHLPAQEIVDQVHSDLYDKVTEAKQIASKNERGDAVKAIRDEYLDAKAPMPGEDEDVSYTAYLRIKKQRKQLSEAFDKIEKKVTRRQMLEGKRADGRGPEDIRPLDVETGVLARTHGSAVFTRGETQALVSVTLGVGKDEQIIDGLHEEFSQKFYLHYNFPPFCVGEARRISGPSRREIGHGALAERSLAGILPTPDKFPYTIRVVSEILESNGSSSMASVCGGCIALMHAGVPIANTTAGISVGLILEDDNHVLLTDILGEEDGYGDMDFKVSGSREGITGIQLDLKARGLTMDLIKETFDRAREARIRIIEKIESVIPKPAEDISRYAPRLLSVKINPEKIGALIGPGGKMIRSIQERSGATIEVDDDGTVMISAVGADKANAAMAEVEKLTEEVQVGKIYTGRVSTVKDFGAFVEVIPGKDGLCHISELADGFVKSVGDVVKVGDMVTVKVINVDEQGRLKLSRKAAMEEQGDNGQEASTEPASTDA